MQSEKFHPKNHRGKNKLKSQVLIQREHIYGLLAQPLALTTSGHGFDLANLQMDETLNRGPISIYDRAV